MQRTSKAQHGSVAVAAPLTGTVRPQPRLVFEGQPWTGASGVATTTMPLANAAAALLVPVKQTTAGCCLEQATTDGWDRRLTPTPNCRTPPAVFLPVTISARTLWHLRHGQLEVFDRGYILDGACRLEAACRCGAPALIPAIILFGLTSDDELQLRSQLSRTTYFHKNSGSSSQEVDEPPYRIDTSTPRMEVSPSWITFTVESEPFVVPTARGYAPAILVRRRGAAQREHLLLGAKSLARPLETIRQRHAALTGQVLDVRKLGREKTAIYELRARSK